MRSKSLLRLPALLLVLVLVLAAGCSDNGGDDDSASNDDDTSEQTDDTNGDSGSDDGDDAPEPSGDGEFGPFCASFFGVLDGYAGSAGDSEDWDAYVAGLSGLEPPSVIASDWALILGVLESDTFTEDDEQAAAEDAAFDNVAQWSIEECGFDPNEVGGDE